MGKRSNFEPDPKDFYRTPRAAALPLIPHLRAAGVRSFAEPCAGDGALVRHLESFGLQCVYSGDIEQGQDALKLTAADLNGADAIITNPPYDTKHRRKLMHAMILHFQSPAPTWLLLHYDWGANEHAPPFLDRCSNIVVIGRVIWMPGTKTGGMENFAWYRFDAGFTGDTVFRNDRGRRQLEMNL